MNRKTIYIAGPMRGLPDNNVQAFNAAARKLSAEGWHPINPAVIGNAFDLDYTTKDYWLLSAVMSAERAAIPHFTAIYLLKGWEKSDGAKRELAVAIANELQIIVEGEE